MSDKILPATDGDIRQMRAELDTVSAAEIVSLIARIEADRATIRAKDALIAELTKALEALTDSAVTDSDACSICLHGVPMHIAGCAKVHALAVLAKSKEAGQ